MPLLYPIAPLPYTGHLVIVVASGVALFAWGSFVRARRQLLLSMARRAEAEQQQRVDEAKQLEREHIAREMHDVLAHRLSLLSMHVGALEFRRDAPTDEVAASLKVIRNSTHQALQDLREVIGVLRTGITDGNGDYPQPTLATVRELVNAAQAAGVQVTYDEHVDDVDSVPASVGRTAYRVVQEAMTNARKHAPGMPVTLDVHGGPGAGLTVRARNALPPTDEPTGVPGAGTGLIGMTERAELAGGRLSHGRTPAGEFGLEAWLPWPT
ncbi:MAG: hypothetical protein GEV07_11145 [Streptosporangiales bacterium]|nr:hypothetical protein [Streptosporangiales bacterium]